MFSWPAALPDYTPPSISLAKEEVDGVLQQGVMVFGVPVGSPAYMKHNFMRERAGTIAANARRIALVLRQDKRALWSALHLSMTQRFGYLQQHVAPSLREATLGFSTA